MHVGVLEVCSICLTNSKDNSLVSIKCYFPEVHSPLQLSTVALNRKNELVPIRPRPIVANKHSFQLCNPRQCKGEKSCIFAHSKIECNAWNFDLKNSKSLYIYYYDIYMYVCILHREKTSSVQV